MNSDIALMVRLQEYWDRVIDGREKIDDGRKNITSLKTGLADLEKKISGLEDDIKLKKAYQKEKELQLAEVEAKIEKLNKTKDLLKTTREVEALDHELETQNSSMDSLEEEVILLMDTIEELESDFSKHKEERVKLEEESGREIMKLEKEISSAGGIVEENENNFREKVANLTPAVKSKFMKLIESESGKAIVSMDGEICEGCNFQVPYHLHLEATKNENIVNCTNCGRFLYNSGK